MSMLPHNGVNSGPLCPVVPWASGGCASDAVLREADTCTTGSDRDQRHGGHAAQVRILVAQWLRRRHGLRPTHKLLVLGQEGRLSSSPHGKVVLGRQPGGQKEGRHPQPVGIRGQKLPQCGHLACRCRPPRPPAPSHRCQSSLGVRLGSHSRRLPRSRPGWMLGVGQHACSPVSEQRVVKRHVIGSVQRVDGGARHDGESGGLGERNQGLAPGRVRDGELGRGLLGRHGGVGR
mmetsp:Transcript_15451/g.46621  ORF Transcript_15451/g.46621 Transcript_15451/m.46621 type:complete len:233 (-) Transcript_15451:1772-2470(-)